MIIGGKGRQEKDMNLLDRLLGQVRFRRSVFERERPPSIPPRSSDWWKVSAMSAEEYCMYLEQYRNGVISSKDWHGWVKEEQYRQDVALCPAGYV